MDSNLRIKDVVERSGLGETTVYREIRVGRLRARKCGRATIVSHDDYRRWIDSLPVRTMTEENAELSKWP